jgi:hypothetical protein
MWVSALLVCSAAAFGTEQPQLAGAGADLGLTVPPADLLDCQEGALPILLVAPHGGIAEPDGYSKVPIGASSLYPYSRDDYTFELAQAVSDALHRKTGARPAMARNLAARSLYDANRARPACCGGLPTADALFHGWHSCVRKLHTEIQKTCGRGLFLDLHGQSHPEKLDWMDRVWVSRQSIWRIG